MRQITDAAADPGGEQSEDGELPEIEMQQQPLRRPQAAHHGTGVEMPLHIAPGSEGHGHRRQHHGQQGRETEELLCPIERGTNLRPTVLRVFYALTTLQARFDVELIALDECRIAGHQQAIADAAADLQQTGRRQIGEIHQQARGDAEEIDAAIGFQGQHGSDAQRRLPDA
jgi:hypothetical protein